MGLAARRDEPCDVFVMQPGIRVCVHRSKFEDREGLHHLPDSHLSEQDRATGSRLHQRGDEQEERGEHHEERQAADDVQPALDRVMDLSLRFTRAQLREEERIDRRKRLLSRTPRRVVHVELHREPGARGRIRSFSERLADSRPPRKPPAG